MLLMWIEELGEDQKESRDALEYESWGYALTLDQFLHRERELRKLPWIRKVSKTWVLKDSRESILASCETFSVRSYCEEGKRGNSLGIGSVYVEPMLRGKGLSTVLLQLLMDQWETSQRSSEPPFHSFFLFSEVGPKLYAKNGFKVLPSEELLLFPHGVLNSYGNLPSVFISEQDFAKLYRFRIQEGFFSIVPSLSQFHWSWKRQNLCAEYLGEDLSPEIGARFKESWIVWAINFRDRSLEILTLRSEKPEEAQVLFHSAGTFAQKKGLHCIKLWMPDPKLDLSCLLNDFRVSSRSREDSLAMIRPVSRLSHTVNFAPVDRSIWV